MNEDGSSEDPINTNHLYILSNKDSKEDEECSKEFKESMEWTKQFIQCHRGYIFLRNVLKTQGNAKNSLGILYLPFLRGKKKTQLV